MPGKTFGEKCSAYDYMPLDKKKGIMENYSPKFSAKTYVVDSQKNPLYETVLLKLSKDVFKLIG